MTFGERLQGVSYRERHGAYVIPINDDGYVAVVEAPVAEGKVCSLFLIGGGLEPGESPEDCIRRECLEETGHEITVGEHLYTGDEYFFAPGDQGNLHAIGACYRATLGRRVQAPMETDHLLRWLPVEACIQGLFLQYQAHGVKTAWENKVKENEI